MGAIVTAWHNKTPLVVTAGQQDRRHAALEPLLSGNLVDLARPYVKRSHEPLRAQDVPGEILRAYHTAMQDPKGPVFVSIPMDDWDAEAEPLPDREVFHEPAPGEEGLKKFAEALAGAKSPALVVGSGVDRAGAFYDAVALAEQLGAAVWEAPMSFRAGFPQNHPLFQGFLVFAQEPLAEQLSGYDVVLVLGAPVFVYYPYVPGPVVKEGTRLFQITEDPEEADRAAVGTSLVGDVRLAIRRLTELLPEDPNRPAPPAAEPPTEPEAKIPMPAAYLMHTLAQVLPDEAAIFDESTSVKATLKEYVRTSRPGGFSDSASGGLGFAMPASVGYKLAQPERPVVCTIGDGSSMYSVQSLYSAARYGANVLFVVVNNEGYYILKGYRDSIGAGDTVPGLDLPALDVVKIAEGFGVAGETVEKPDALEDALRDALGSGRPYLLNVLVEPEVPELPS
jgi:benzoylformate decarboxylase